MDWFGFGRSDPFARFYKYSKTNEHQLVHETEIVDKNLNPTWKGWQIEKEKLCQNFESFHVEVSDYNTTGGAKLVN